MCWTRTNQTAKRTATQVGIALACVAWTLSVVADTDILSLPENAIPPAKAKVDTAGTWDYIARLRGDWGDAVSIALVDDPNIVITADSRGKVTVWDTEEGVQRFSTPPHAGALPMVVADAAGRRIAVGATGQGGTVTVWDTSTGARLHDFRGVHPDISRDGSVLAAITAHDAVTLWDVDSGDAIGSIVSGRPVARAVSLDAKGARVAIGWANKRAEVWDVGSGERLMEVKGHGGAVNAVDLTPDGSRLATAAGDNRARVWEVDTGELLGTYGSKYRVSISNVFIDNAGEQVLAAVGARFADLWHVRSEMRVRRHGSKKSRVGAVALSPDGARLAGVHRRLGYSLWATDTGERVPAGESRRHLRMTRVQLSADGNRALAFALDGYATLHDVTTGKEIRSFGELPDEEPALFAGRASPLRVRLIGDGRHYLDAFSGSPMTVRDVATDAAITTFDAEPRWYPPLILSPDHSLLLTGGVGKHAHLWDVATGAHLHELAVDGDRVYSAAFDATNATVVTNGQQGPVRVWDTATGEIRATVSVRGAARDAVSVSPDGRYLLLSRGSQAAARDEPPPADGAPVGSQHDHAGRGVDGADRQRRVGRGLAAVLYSGPGQTPGTGRESLVPTHVWPIARHA